MFLRQISPPDPVTAYLDAVKAQLRIGFSDKDDLLGDIIGAAYQMVEQMAGRPILSQTWRIERRGQIGDLKFPKVPVQSVDEITFFDPGNVQQTADVDDFILYGDDECAFLQPGPDATWPDVYDRPDALRVQFTCGYATPPVNLDRAVILLADEWFERRDLLEERQIPRAVTDLVNLSRRGWFAA